MKSTKEEYEQLNKRIKELFELSDNLIWFQRVCIFFQLTCVFLFFIFSNIKIFVLFNLLFFIIIIISVVYYFVSIRPRINSILIKKIKLLKGELGDIK